MSNETMEMEDEKIIVIEEKRPNPISRFLDRIFHFTDRGTTMGSEIGAGIGAFFIAVCALIMNTQIIGAAYGNYAGSYLAVTLIAFAGTLLLGIVCNLPLLQSANMGLASVLISMMGADSGLTYANLMLVTFVAAVIYLVVVLTPARRVLVDALPEGVKKAMPVGIGLYIMHTALKNSGLLTAAGTAATGSGFTTLFTYYFWLLIAGTVIFVILKAMNRKKPAFATFGILIGAMWIGGILFFMDYFIGGQTAATIVYERLNLVFATDGASPYNLGLGFESLKLGALFTEGLDFSAYQAAGGSVPMLFLQGILTFLFLGLYTNLGNTQAAAEVGGYENEGYAETGSRKAQIVGAAMNVVSPLLGASPTSIGAHSAVGTHDGAKTGLSSVTAALGYLIALFSWIFIMFFATGTNGVGMWINESEIKLAAYVQDTFAFADLIMVLVGASMLKTARKWDLSRLEEAVSIVAAIAGIALFGNIALGVALGTVLHLVCKLAGRQFREITPPTIILSVVMLIYLILTLI